MARLLKSVADSQLQIQISKDVWAGSLFESMDPLKPDYVGKVGEKLLAELCRSNGIDHIYTNDDTNSTDGTYDIIISGKKIEVKTARIGVQKTFQHETLRARGYDFYIFVAVKPNEFFLSVLPKFDMTLPHSVFGVTPHLRKGTSDVYKLTLSETNLLRGVNKGITLKVTADTPEETIGAFLKNQIVRESEMSSG
jgi:hypothetical protein